MDCIITDPSTLSLQNNYRDDIYVLGEDEDHICTPCSIPPIYPLEIPIFRSKQQTHNSKLLCVEN